MHRVSHVVSRVRSRRPASHAAGRIARAIVLLVLAGSAACRGPVQPYETLAPHVANLRAQFNRDAGHVRIVILPAPT